MLAVHADHDARDVTDPQGRWRLKSCGSSRERFVESEAAIFLPTRGTEEDLPDTEEVEERHAGTHEIREVREFFAMTVSRQREWVANLLERISDALHRLASGHGDLPFPEGHGERTMEFFAEQTSLRRPWSGEGSHIHDVRFLAEFILSRVEGLEMTNGRRGSVFAYS